MKNFRKIADEIPAYENGNNYVVQAWVCDYGIYDIDNQKFIGKPIDYNREAMIIAKFLNDSGLRLVEPTATLEAENKELREVANKALIRLGKLSIENEKWQSTAKDLAEAVEQIYKLTTDFTADSLMLIECVSKSALQTYKILTDGKNI